MEEEINIRELITVLINGKRLIFGICFIAVLIAGILSFFVLPEKFEAKTNIILDKKLIDQQGLSLDSYKELVSNNIIMEQVYNKLNLESKGILFDNFKKSVKTEVKKEANLISITVRGEDPVLTQQAANLTGAESVSYFRNRLIDDKEREIVRAGKMLLEVETKLKETPRLLGTFEVQDMGDRVIQVPQVNPLYEMLSTRWEGSNAEVTNLMAEKEYLEENLETGGTGLYIILQEADVPTEPVSPRKLFNMAIAGILGLMVSVFLVFLKDYWLKTTPLNNVSGDQDM